MDKKLSGKTILKPVFITGVILLAVSLGFILWTFWLSRGDYSLKPDKPSDFHKKLILFDEVLRTAGEQGGVNHTHIANLLEALDESAVGAESRLSLLKRYRNLAKRYPEYFEAYREAAGQALKKFPHSALIAALSAEAALEAPPEAAVNQDSEDNGLTEKLKEAAFLLTENGPLSEAAFFPAAFCFYALSGEFKDINSALALKRAGELFTAFSASLPTGAGNDIAGRVRESMLVDAALVEIANGDGNEAAALARLEPRKAILPKTTDFIANYSYDFADPLLAAELWSSTGAEKDIARAASALYIAGDTENARKLWLLLAKDVKNDSTERGNAESAQRALYNLASITAEKSEKTGYAEQVLAGGSAVNRDTLTAALVLYTRLMPAERALDILSEHPLTKQEALPDIEHLRRSLESTPPDRVVAETWLLLNRHPEAPDIYRWAAWYFEHQRRYEDLDALRHFAVQNHVESPFLTFHYALRLVRNGDMKKGAELLESGAAPLSWQRYANIALVLDAGHEYAAALKYYEDAAALIPGDAKAATHADAAKIYLKLARCRRILGGKPDEIRRDLERAFTLDRENVDVRLALRRMS